MNPIRAEFVNTKRVASRKALQIILEVPEESQGEVFAALGYPISGESKYVAVVRLESGDVA